MVKAIRHKRRYAVPIKNDSGMNKTEQAYSELLDARKSAGEIVRYAFEKIKFKLANNTHYTPDFYVVCPGHIEIHEVKGFWQDDAKVKIKVAAEMFPEFKFLAVKWKNKREGWVFEEF